MARELQQTAPDDRRRRVQRLKKMIIGIVIVGLLIPILCCVYLICRLHANEIIGKRLADNEVEGDKE